MENTDLNKKAGARLKELRLSKNMTQTELAEKLGVTHPTIVRYEKGDVGAMKTSVISKLATIFDVSPIYILGMEYKDIDAEPMIKVYKMPVLGNVCAGDGMWCEENFEGYIYMDKKITNADFALIIHGDSMTGDGIKDGDTAFVKKTNIVDSGKIAIVLLTDTNEVVVKRLFIKDDGIFLQSSNPKYKPIVTKDFLILGELVGFYHEI